MLNKTLFLFFILFHLNYLSAYELPEVELNKNGKPEIILFSAQSVLVKEKLSYKIKWKTLNATDVQITHLGRVAPSGSVTVTEDEYNRGPITLTASSRNSSLSDSKTINTHKNVDAPPVVFAKPKSQNRSMYATPMLHPRGMRRAPYRRRYY